MIMFKKLRNRFILLNMAIISVMMIVAFVVIYIMTYTNIQNENHRKLSKISTTMAVTTQEIISDTVVNVRVEVPDEYALSFNVVVDGGGRPISTHSFVDMPEEVYINAAASALATQKDTSSISVGGKRWMFQVTQMGNIAVSEKANDDATVVYEIEYIDDYKKISFLDVTESQHILTQLLVTFGAMGFAMLFVIFGISIFFARRAIAPVELAYTKQRQFITDASHELKTPIASIDANTDALVANRHDTIESQVKWVEYIKAETDRMGKLVNDLLYLAKTDNAEINAERLPFNISDTIRDAILSMEAVAFEKGLTLTQRIEPDMMINGESDRLAQVVKILFDNAIKYSNDRGSIDIALRRVRHQVVFSIQNTGKGIPAEHLSKLFDRFYRVDPSRTYDGSYGLGLSIAKAIIDNMGGKIYATSVEGQSATFVFVL